MKKGFTLVELMCVISIILIMCGAAYPTIGSFLRKDRLKRATQELVVDLKYAKTYAISHHSSPVSILFEARAGGGGFDGYWIYLPSGGYSMTLKRVYLPKGVIICPRGDGTTINIDNKLYFKPGGNVAPFACTIALKDLDTGIKRYITLTIGFTRIMESSAAL